MSNPFEHMFFPLSEPSTASSSNTLASVLHARASDDLFRDKLLYTFLDSTGREEANLSFSTLLAYASLLAEELARTYSVKETDRVLILTPTHAAFPVSFLACLLGKFVAVPVAVPFDERGIERLLAIQKDSDSKVVLVTSMMRPFEDMFENLTMVYVDQWMSKIESAKGKAVAPEENVLRSQIAHQKMEDLAFLQYSSGSTGMPKGVMVDNSNLTANHEMIRRRLNATASDTIVSWCPAYHDMGLIGNVLFAAYVGARLILLSPVDFIRRPQLWPLTISKYKGTISGGPNFGYELLVRKVSDADWAKLDFSSWRAAFSGAEMVRASTIRSFAERFGPRGFRNSVWWPCYGLAEATLMVTAPKQLVDPRILKFSDHPDLGKKNPWIVAADKEFVSVGEMADGLDIRIVNPESCVAKGPQEEGEIWVSGPNVCRGYWKKEELNGGLFFAQIAGEASGKRYLRTGDMGFFFEDQLYITGRIKDILKINGVNIFPTDIEQAAELSFSDIRPGCSACFGYAPPGQGEQAVIFVEQAKGVAGQYDDVWFSRFQALISSKFRLQMYAVVVLTERVVPKTSSGKIQRYACRRMFEDNISQNPAVVAMKVFASDSTSRTAVDNEASSEQPAESTSLITNDDSDLQSFGQRLRSSSSIAAFKSVLRDWIAAEFAVKPNDIRDRDNFATYGLNSATAVSTAERLGQSLQVKLGPDTLFQHSTMDALTSHLAAKLSLFGKGVPTTSTDDASVTKTVLEQSAAPSSVVQKEIAVVGISLRLPCVSSVSDLWKALMEGKECRNAVKRSRFIDSDPSEGDESVEGYFLDNISEFDHKFWKISHAEAAMMDPQHRILLELAVECLHDSGAAISDVKGLDIGVYVGLSGHEYSILTSGLKAQSSAQASYVATGGSGAMAANRISYLLDLHGPSMSVDTACSSSLVALDLAFQDLRQGKTTSALVAASNLILTQGLCTSLEKAGFLAPDGRCKTFDASADGYGRAEGACMVLLKPLEDAIREGNRIYSVVLGTHSNSNGRSMSQTAPSFDAQVRLMKSAYESYGLNPADVFYVEAHGTGTSAGDPIESKALGDVIGQGKNRLSPCMVGSIKSNIGHTEAAAGLAGFIKASLIAFHGVIPPTLHVKQLNPSIDFGGMNLKVALQVMQCPENGLIGINSLGFGGTNAHAILRRVKPSERENIEKILSESLKSLSVKDASEPQVMKWRKKYAQEPVPLPISGMTSEGLAKYAKKLEDWATESGVDLLDVAAALAVAEHYEKRFAPLVGSVQEIAKARDGVSRSTNNNQASQLAFVFSGQGSEWIGMGKALYLRSPVFQKAVDNVDSLLSAEFDISIAEELLRERPDDENEKWNTDYAQPLLFSVQWALTVLLKSLEITPTVCVGHSAGEIAAAAAAGILDWKLAARLAALRGRYMNECTGNGGMLAVELSEEDVSDSVGGDMMARSVVLATVNSSSSCVLSGPIKELQDIEQDLRSKKVRVKFITKSYAFHHPSLSSAASKLKERLEKDCILVSGVATAGFVSTSELFSVQAGERCVRLAEPAYWACQITNPVRFRDAAVNSFSQFGMDAFVEISPHPVLLPRLAEIVEVLSNLLSGTRSILVLESLKRGGNDRSSFLRVVGDLWAAGYPVAWHRLFGVPASKVDKVRLPAYSWDRVPCWVDGKIQNAVSVAGNGGTHALGASSVPGADDVDLSNTDVSYLAPIIASLFAEFMDIKTDEIKFERPLQDYGMDSLAKARFRNVVFDVFGVRFPMHIPQELITIDFLANNVSEQLGEVAKRDSVQVAHSTSHDSGSATSAPAQSAVTGPVQANRGRIRIEADLSEDIKEFQERMKVIDKYKIENPFYRVQDSVSENIAIINGRRLVNFSCYNYLGLSGSATLNEAAKQSIDKFGTSVSGSRILSGEKTVHRELEAELASFLGCEDALVMLGGHSCNESTIGHIVDADYDLIIADEAVHNSIAKGMQLSKCTYVMFAHNDMEDLEAKLTLHRYAYRRCLLVVEGLYSMDADFPNLFQLVRIKDKYKCILYIDEAHSCGVMGDTGRGITELFPINKDDPSIILMGTLSKALGSCGGYLAGKREVINYLRYTIPGFIFSAGITPPNTASALAAVRELKRTNVRVRNLQFNAQRFASRALERKLDVRFRFPSGIVMVLLYDSDRCVAVSAMMYELGYFVNPAIYPAVPMGQARLRFFLSSLHTEEQIDQCVDTLAEVVQQVFQGSEDDIRELAAGARSHRMSLRGDMESISAIAVPGVIRQGWLVKRGHLRKNWLMRWFRLTPKYFSYGPSEHDRAKRSIPLSSIQSVTMLDQAVLGQKNCFMVNGGGFVLYVYASTERSAQEWVNSLIKAKREANLTESRCDQ
eukprot:ANDGO_07383.mRNA.1 Phthiocerol synthesis polyketide synthase type I PpsA